MTESNSAVCPLRGCNQLLRRQSRGERLQRWWRADCAPVWRIGTTGPWVNGSTSTVQPGQYKAWVIPETQSNAPFTDFKFAGLAVLPPFGGGTFIARAGYAD